MLERLDALLETAVGLVWGNWLVALLLLTGAYLTVRLGFPQIRGFRHALQVIRGRYDDPEEPGEISHFQALAAALSATVGLGNIAGVAIAVSAGGPGALVWMWVSGFLGMATKCTSCTLAVKYRHFDERGRVLGGPMHYIELGLGQRWRPVAALFAALVAVAAFGGGNMFQANQVASALRNLDIDPRATGLVLAVGVALVIIGGIKRIGQVASKIVPFMIAIYVAGAIVVIVAHLAEIPAVLALILRDAFTGEALLGGAFGEVVRQGIRRGTFSNESGLGSAPIAHAAAQTDEPTREGLVGLLEPFIDTIVVCTMTGLVIIFAGVYRPTGEITTIQSSAEGTAAVLHFPVGPLPQEGSRLTIVEHRETIAELRVAHVDAERRTVRAEVPPKVRDRIHPGLRARLGSGVQLTAAAFDSVLTGFGTFFVSLAVALFAFSTMISWSYYGEQGARYLFGARASLPYKWLFVLAVFVGAIWRIDPVVDFSDLSFGLMALPNILALWLLSGDVHREHQDYFERMRARGEL